LNLSAIPLVKSPIKISTSSHCFVFWKSLYSIYNFVSI
jgi:hypothetical protein